MATKIILKGHVQGVGCRGYCARYARKYSLSGAATNQSDGSVCIILDTDNAALISSYMNSLVANSDRYNFFGRITDYKVVPFKGAIDGDYIF